MRWCLQPGQTAQVFQLLRNRTSIHTVTRRLVVSSNTVSRAWRRCRRSSLTWREVGRAVEGHQHSSSTSIYSFVCEETGALPESYRMTSNKLLVCMLLTKLSETDSMRMWDAERSPQIRMLKACQLRTGPWPNGRWWLLPTRWLGRDGTMLLQGKKTSQQT